MRTVFLSSNERSHKGSYLLMKTNCHAHRRLKFLEKKSICSEVVLKVNGKLLGEGNVPVSFYPLFQNGPTLRYCHSPIIVCFVVQNLLTFSNISVITEYIFLKLCLPSKGEPIPEGEVILKNFYSYAPFST